MGKIILTVEGTTVGTVAQGGGVVIERTVSEQDSGRLVQAFAKVYGAKWVNEDGTPRAPSIAEVLGAWFEGVVAESTAKVLEVERAEAARIAAEQVAPISVA
jgi:hypothetical protein